MDDGLYLTFISLSSFSDADGLTVVPGFDILIYDDATKRVSFLSSVSSWNGAKRNQTYHDVPKSILHVVTTLLGLLLSLQNLALRRFSSRRRSEHCGSEYDRGGVRVGELDGDVADVGEEAVAQGEVEGKGERGKGTSAMAKARAGSPTHLMRNEFLTNPPLMKMDLIS